MKRVIYITTLLALFGLSSTTNAQTSIANGNWSDPATWGGVPPITTGTVIINHDVILDIDYAHNAGSITIGSSGSLNGVLPMRGFALNLSNGTATLTVNGSFNVARVSLFSSTVTITGTFEADSLFNTSSITNAGGSVLNAGQFMNNTGGTIINGGLIVSDSLLNADLLTNLSGATIDASQFSNYTGATLNNDGSLVSVDFLNLGSVNNTNHIRFNDFTNSKSFINSNTGVINVTNDFANTDTPLGSPATFTNDGVVSVVHDWHNGKQMDGSGKICVGNNSLNTGTMTGTFDFCDQTGGNIDLNTGTVAGTITFCVNPCVVGIEELSIDVLVNVYPNPFSTQTVLQTDNVLNNASITVYNYFGQKVKQMDNLNGQTFILQRDNLPSGMYFVRLTQDGNVIGENKIMITDN